MQILNNFSSGNLLNAHLKGSYPEIKRNIEVTFPLRHFDIIWKLPTGWLEQVYFKEHHWIHDEKSIFYLERKALYKAWENCLFSNEPYEMPMLNIMLKNPEWVKKSPLMAVLVFNKALYENRYPLTKVVDLWFETFIEDIRKEHIYHILFKAIECDDIEILTKIYHYGISFSRQYPHSVTEFIDEKFHGSTPFHHAVLQKNRLLAEDLLSMQVSVHCIDKYGKTVLDYYLYENLHFIHENADIVYWILRKYEMERPLNISNEHLNKLLDAILQYNLWPLLFVLMDLDVNIEHRKEEILYDAIESEQCYLVTRLVKEYSYKLNDKMIEYTEDWEDVYYSINFKRIFKNPEKKLSLCNKSKFFRKVITEKLLANFVGDSFISQMEGEEEDYEGFCLLTSLSFTSIFCEHIKKKFSPEIAFKLTEISETLFEGYQFESLIMSMINLPYSCLKSSIHTCALYFKNKLLGLIQTEKQFLFPCGWLENDEGHAMLMSWKFEKDQKGFFLQVFNTGYGINHYHFFFQNEENLKCVPYRNYYVPLADIENLQLLEILLEPLLGGCHTNTYDPMQIYAALIPYSYTEDLPQKEHWMKPQNSGTCAAKVVYAYIRHELDLKNYKKFKYLIDKFIIKKSMKYFGKNDVVNKKTALLLSMSINVLSKKIFKAVKSGIYDLKILQKERIFIEAQNKNLIESYKSSICKQLSSSTASCNLSKIQLLTKNEELSFKQKNWRHLPGRPLLKIKTFKELLKNLQTCKKYLNNDFMLENSVFIEHLFADLSFLLLEDHPFDYSYFKESSCNRLMKLLNFFIRKYQSTDMQSINTKIFYLTSWTIILALSIRLQEYLKISGNGSLKFYNWRGEALEKHFIQMKDQLLDTFDQKLQISRCLHFIKQNEGKGKKIFNFENNQKIFESYDQDSSGRTNLERSYSYLPSSSGDCDLIKSLNLNNLSDFEEARIREGYEEAIRRSVFFDDVNYEEWKDAWLYVKGPLPNYYLRLRELSLKLQLILSGEILRNFSKKICFEGPFLKEAFKDYFSPPIIVTYFYRIGYNSYKVFDSLTLEKDENVINIDAVVNKKIPFRNACTQTNSSALEIGYNILSAYNIDPHSNCVVLSMYLDYFQNNLHVLLEKNYQELSFYLFFTPFRLSEGFSFSFAKELIHLLNSAEKLFSFDLFKNENTKQNENGLIFIYNFKQKVLQYAFGLLQSKENFFIKILQKLRHSIRLLQSSSTSPSFKMRLQHSLLLTYQVNRPLDLNESLELFGLSFLFLEDALKSCLDSKTYESIFSTHSFSLKRFIKKNPVLFEEFFLSKLNQMIPHRKLKKFTSGLIYPFYSLKFQDGFECVFNLKNGKLTINKYPIYFQLYDYFKRNHISDCFDEKGILYRSCNALKMEGKDSFSTFQIYLDSADKIKSIQRKIDDSWYEHCECGKDKTSFFFPHCLTEINIWKNRDSTDFFQFFVTTKKKNQLLYRVDVNHNYYPSYLDSKWGYHWIKTDSSEELLPFYYFDTQSIQWIPNDPTLQKIIEFPKLIQESGEKLFFEIQTENKESKYYLKGSHYYADDEDLNELFYLKNQILLKTETGKRALLLWNSKYRDEEDFYICHQIPLEGEMPILTTPKDVVRFAYHCLEDAYSAHIFLLIFNLLKRFHYLPVHDSQTLSALKNIVEFSTCNVPNVLAIRLYALWLIYQNFPKKNILDYFYVHSSLIKEYIKNKKSISCEFRIENYLHPQELEAFKFQHYSNGALFSRPPRDLSYEIFNQNKHKDLVVHPLKFQGKSQEWKPYYWMHPGNEMEKRLKRLLFYIENNQTFRMMELHLHASVGSQTKSLHPLLYACYLAKTEKAPLNLLEEAKKVKHYVLYDLDVNMLNAAINSFRSYLFHVDSFDYDHPKNSMLLTNKPDARYHEIFNENLVILPLQENKDIDFQDLFFKFFIEKKHMVKINSFKSLKLYTNEIFILKSIKKLNKELSFSYLEQGINASYQLRSCFSIEEIKEEVAFHKGEYAFDMSLLQKYQKDIYHLLNDKDTAPESFLNSIDLVSSLYLSFAIKAFTYGSKQAYQKNNISYADENKLYKLHQTIAKYLNVKKRVLHRKNLISLIDQYAVNPKKISSLIQAFTSQSHYKMGSTLADTILLQIESHFGTFFSKQEINIIKKIAPLTFQDDMKDFVFFQNSIEYWPLLLAALKMKTRKLAIHVTLPTNYLNTFHTLPRKLLDLSDQKTISFPLETFNSEEVCTKVLNAFKTSLMIALESGQNMVLTNETLLFLRGEYLKLIFGNNLSLNASLKYCILREIIELIKENAVFTLDQFDEILSPMTTVIHPIGFESRLDLLEIELIKTIYIHSLTSKKNSGEERFREILLKLLHDEKWLAFFGAFNESDKIKSLEAYFFEKNSPLPSYLEENIESANLVILTKKLLIDGWLEEALSKKMYVDFGPSHLENGPGYAIPYNFNMCPMEGYTFRNSYMLTLYTFILYTQEGLNKGQIKEFVTALKKKAFLEFERNKQKTPLSFTKTCKRFERLFHLKLEDVNSENDRHCEMINHRLKSKNKKVLNLFLTCVIDNILQKVKISDFEIRGNGQNLLSMGKNFVGYSDSINACSLLPYQISEEQFYIEHGNKGKIVDSIIQEHNQIHVIKEDEYALLTFLKEQLKNHSIQVIMDLGAFFCGYKAEAVASMLCTLLKEDPLMKGVVYYNSKCDLCFMGKQDLREKKLKSVDEKSLELETCCLKHELFFYYEEKDLKKRPFLIDDWAITLITWKENNTFSDFAKCHKLSLELLSKETKWFILSDHQALKINKNIPSQKLSLRELVLHAYQKEINTQMMDNLIICSNQLQDIAQNYFFQIRKEELYEELIEQSAPLFTRFKRLSLYELYGKEPIFISSLYYLNKIKRELLRILKNLSSNTTEFEKKMDMVILRASKTIPKRVAVHPDFKYYPLDFLIAKDNDIGISFEKKDLMEIPKRDEHVPAFIYKANLQLRMEKPISLKYFFYYENYVNNPPNYDFDFHMCNFRQFISFKFLLNLPFNHIFCTSNFAKTYKNEFNFSKFFNKDLFNFVLLHEKKHKKDKWTMFLVTTEESVDIEKLLKIKTREQNKTLWLLRSNGRNVLDNTSHFVRHYANVPIVNQSLMLMHFLKGDFRMLSKKPWKSLFFSWLQSMSPENLLETRFFFERMVSPENFQDYKNSKIYNHFRNPQIEV